MTSSRPFVRSLLLIASGLCLLASPAAAQEAAPAAALAALQDAVTQAIARAERSVVAIARVRRRPSGPVAPENLAPPALPGLGLTDPTDPAFVPDEFGTGVVIDAQGLIVTNLHVIGDHRTADYFVWMSRQPYAAQLKAVDPWLDLAVLQVAAQGLRPMPLGDAAQLKKGQFVIALGNPYALARDGEPSATWGLVSNLHRQAPPPRSLAARPSEPRQTLHHWGTLIQTDARLELGSSGGALVNLEGQMVGLTTSLAALSGYERPGGLAIPVDDDFRRALETLKTGRLPDYGFLGVAPRYLTVAERQRGWLGARVDDVVPATPAARAGLQAGDILTHFDGQPLADDLDLLRRVGGRHAESVVSLSLVRGADGRRPGRPQTVEVKLSKKRPPDHRSGFAAAPAESWRGLEVDYATAAPQFRERCRDLDPAGSVGVLAVAADSPAWRAGLRPGDFITHAGTARVATPAEFYAAVAPLSGEVALQLSPLDTARPTRVVAP